MPTDRELLNQKLISIQAWARGLEKEAAEARKLLEGVSTPSLHKGTEEIVAKIMTRIQQRAIKKQIQKKL